MTCPGGKQLPAGGKPRVLAGGGVLRTSGADPAFDPEGFLTTNMIRLINCINIGTKFA